MMRNLLALLVFFLIQLLYPSNALADEYYDIENFRSEINVEQNLSITVKETIDVNFKIPKHGIYRIIPVLYTFRDKTIDSRVKILSVTDEVGNRYNFETERFKQSLSLKIGDEDVTLTGPKTYVITYSARNVLQKYDDTYELYWNVTGREWDTEILQTYATVNSKFAEMGRIDCFAGVFGSQERKCMAVTNSRSADFISNDLIRPGSDLTVVVEFSPRNQFIEPTRFEKTLQVLIDNWGYFVSPIPLYFIFYFWYKRGRDERYTGANIYYKEDKAGVETKPLFAREHLPLVYHPIDGLSPSEVGVIVDEKVDIEDVLSEILELARLGFFEIRKIVKKKIFKDQVEYAFVKSGNLDKKKSSELEDYQEYLLSEIFKSTNIEKSKELSEELLKGDSKEAHEARKLLSGKEFVLLSALKNKFYESLNKFKEKVYKRMQTENLFYEDPEKIRVKWIGVYFVICFVAGWITFVFAANTYNFGPVIALLLLSIPGFFLSLKMPRRTPKGYSYKRQIEGLSWYLEKGKWRHEVSEKNLFIEEVLPLAVALGVINKLTRDMADLGVKPPEYISGATANTFASDFSGFRTASTNSFFSTPQGKWSGSSSWSGGSGFSGGGSSGGGFGGGGGGSW